MKHILTAIAALVPSLALAQTTGLSVAKLSDIKGGACPSTTYVLIDDPVKRGLFYYDGSGATGNDGTTISCGGKMYRRLYSGAVDARWFGLVEAAGTNTAAADANVVAVNNAITALRGGEELFIPPGIYYFSSPIYLPTAKPIRLTAMATLMFPNSDGVVVRNRNHVVDLNAVIGQVDSPTSTSNGYSGIAVLDGSNNEIRVGQVSGFNYGIKMEGAVQYNRVQFSALTNNVGIKFNAETSAGWVNENTFFGGDIRGNVGVEAKRTANLDPFNGNKFFGMGFEDVGLAMDTEGFEMNLIIGPRFEKSAQSGLKFGERSKFNTVLVGAIYENKLYGNGLNGNLGASSVLLGNLLTTGANRSGAVSLSDGSGNVLGIVGQAGSQAPVTSVIKKITPLWDMPETVSPVNGNP